MRSRKKQNKSAEDEWRILYHKPNKEALIQDILNIRRDPDFKPDYGVQCSGKTCPRPVEFKGGFTEWFEQMRKEHRESELKKISEKQRKQKLKLVIEICYVPHVMNSMMKID